MIRMRPGLRFAAIVLSSVLAFPVAAQPVVDLGGFASCRTCIVSAQPILRLGDASGDGIIEGDYADVRYGDAARLYAIFQRGGSRILLFDSAGGFVRRIGRGGQGPGEIETLIDAHFQGRRIVALDRAKLLVMDLFGKAIAESRLPVRAGSFRAMSDSTVVVGSMEMTPGFEGRALHVLMSATGQPVKSLGATHPTWSAGARTAGDVALGWSAPPTTFWIGHPASFHIEQWHFDGRLLQTVRGDFPWFRPPDRPGRDSPPGPLLLGFATDGEDRLWTLTRVPDARWREAPRRGNEGYVLSQDMGSYIDTRIDVFDLRGRRHLGTMTWDEAYVGMVQIGGRLALQKVTLDADLTPRVTLYSLIFRGVDRE